MGSNCIFMWYHCTLGYVVGTNGRLVTLLECLLHAVCQTRARGPHAPPPPCHGLYVPSLLNQYLRIAALTCPKPFVGCLIIMSCLSPSRATVSLPRGQAAVQCAAAASQAAAMHYRALLGSLMLFSSCLGGGPPSSLVVPSIRQYYSRMH